MSWCKFDDAADGEKMALAASVVGDSAVAFWFRAVLHCSRNRTDGFVDARLVARFTSHRKPLDVVAALVDARVRPDGVGLLVPCDGGWMVHDYLQFNRSREEAEADDAHRESEKQANKERMKAARDAKRAASVRPVTERTTGERSEVVQPPCALSSRTPAHTTRDPVPSHVDPKEKKQSAQAPAALPQSDLAVEILALAAGHHRIAPLVDAAFASELALIAERGGKARLVSQAFEEAAGEIAAQSITDHGKARSLIQRYVRNVRPLAGVSGTGGGSGAYGAPKAHHGPPGRPEPYNPFGPPTDEELRANGVIQ